MSGRFVRASKYRHVFGRPTKKEQCYDNLRISKNAWDTNLIKVNPRYLAVNWEASGGGAFAVIPLGERGRLPDIIPLFRGHTATVLDTDWNPFNDSLIASGSDDAKVNLYRVPEGFTLYTPPETDPVDVLPVGKLTGHSRKVGHVLFNPAAENVLASASADHLLKIWDIEAGAAKLHLKHNDIVQSLCWNADGSLLVTTSRDKKLRVWDVRQESPAFESEGHPGAKSSRSVWMGEHDRIATTGFSRMSDRQLGLWDPRNMRLPINGLEILDSISGINMPFWDDGTQCLYLAGKGDGNIRYFEYSNDKFEFLSEYKSSDPQRGMGFVPKRGVNVHENEVMRAYKVVGDTYIEPVSFIVPRRAEVFQGDIYPPTTGLKAAMSSGEWFGGKTAIPPKVSMESIYEGHESQEIRSGPTNPISPTISTEPEAKKEEPVQSPVAKVSPTMSEQKSSIAAIAAKFADSGPAEPEEEDDSSFEEIHKPPERLENRVYTPPKKEEAKTIAPPRKVEPVVDEKFPVAKSVNQLSSSSIHPNDIQAYLQEIKAILEKQNVTMKNLSDMIQKLDTEMTALKAKIDKNE